MSASDSFDVHFSGSHALKLPESRVKPFLRAGRKRVEVIATFEGKSISFHAAIQKYREDFHIVFGKKHQKELGVFPNDMIRLELCEDKTLYGVEMPAELDAVLTSDPEVATIFKGLTDGRKRSIIFMILRYKNIQTRIDKSLLICENLKRGVRKPADLLKSN